MKLEHFTTYKGCNSREGDKSLQKGESVTIAVNKLGHQKAGQVNGNDRSGTEGDKPIGIYGSHHAVGGSIRPQELVDRARGVDEAHAPCKPDVSQLDGKGVSRKVNRLDAKATCDVSLIREEARNNIAAGSLTRVKGIITSGPRHGLAVTRRNSSKSLHGAHKVITRIIGVDNIAQKTVRGGITLIQHNRMPAVFQTVLLGPLIPHIKSGSNKVANISKRGHIKHGGITGGAKLHHAILVGRRGRARGLHGRGSGAWGQRGRHGGGDGAGGLNASGAGRLESARHEVADGGDVGGVCGAPRVACVDVT